MKKQIWILEKGGYFTAFEDEGMTQYIATSADEKRVIEMAIERLSSKKLMPRPVYIEVE